MGPARSADRSSERVPPPLERLFCLPRIISFFACIFPRNNYKNQGFWLPKTLPKPMQNCFKIDVPKNMRFCIDFCLIFVVCCKGRTSKFMRPRSVLWTFHQNQLFTFGMHFGSEKPTKNPSKTMPNLWKIDAKNASFFNIDFFRFWGRFWRVLGLQLGGPRGPKIESKTRKNWY